jgi:hypothetical protein
VKNVLKHLENLTIKNKEENDELNELKVKVNYLETEKYQKINEREKFEKVSKIFDFLSFSQLLKNMINVMCVKRSLKKSKRNGNKKRSNLLALSIS